LYLKRAFKETAAIKGKPSIIIADTIKGKGVCFAENTAAFHNGIMTAQQYELACKNLCPEEE
jgi:transketolase